MKKNLHKPNNFSNKKLIILFIIFFFGFFLRTYNLTSLPLGFYEEEVTNSYVGRFILQNGKDLYGNILPLIYFDKFGDYPPVLPMYLSGLATFFLGVNEFAARFPIALIGAIMIFAIYKLTKIVFKNEIISLLSALFLSILPWHIVLSRTTAEGIVGLTAVCVSLFYLFDGIETNNRKKIYLAALWLILSYFLYPSFRVLAPLIWLPTIWLTDQKYIKKTLFFFAIFFFALTIVISITHWGKGRFIQTSFFNNQEIKEHAGLQITALSYGDGSQNVLITRIFHNKVVVLTRAFINEYLNYFSPKFLFLEAGGQRRYYNVPYQGLIPIVFTLFLLFSIIPINKAINPKYLAFLVFLLLISPLPSALTVDFPPHVHRAIFMILPLVILASYGAYNLILIFNKPKLILTLIIFILTLETLYFWHQYTYHEAGENSILRNGGDKELAKYIIKNRQNYDKIIVPGFARIPIYYLYFSKNFSSNLIGKIKIELRINEVDNVIFANDWCPTKYLNTNDLSAKTMIIDRAGCEGKDDYKQIEGIDRKDSTSAYKILTPQ